MKKLLSLSAVALGLLAFAGSAQAQVISLQYNANSLTSTGTGPSAGFIPETIWNNDTSSVPYFADGTASKSNLIDSTGTTTGISESLTTYAGYYAGAATAFTNAGDNDLYSHGFLTYAANSGLLTLSGLNSSLTYNLLVYVRDPNGNANTLVNITDSVDSQSYYLKTPSNASLSSYVLGSGTTSGSATVGADYFDLTGLTGSSTIQADIAASGGINIVGFQLQVASAAPEPSAILLMGAGLVGLMLFVRRKSAVRS